MSDTIRWSRGLVSSFLCLMPIINQCRFVFYSGVVANQRSWTSVRLCFTRTSCTLRLIQWMTKDPTTDSHKLRQVEKQHKTTKEKKLSQSNSFRSYFYQPKAFQTWEGTTTWIHLTEPMLHHCILHLHKPFLISIFPSSFLDLVLDVMTSFGHKSLP